jgi:ribosomal protein S18 acetylase RimI-like enzyme
LGGGQIAKMAINEKYQGLGIGKILMDVVIQKARELNLHKLVLYSSTKLTTALGMYTKFGFLVVPLDDHPTSRANIKMEIIINK